MNRIGLSQRISRLREWVSKRGMLSVGAVVGVTAVFLVSGVGVTMAATGTLPSVFLATAEASTDPVRAATPPPTTAPRPGKTAMPDVFDAYDGIDWESVVASGFTGLQISFTPGHVSFIAQALKSSDGSLSVDFMINGQVWATSNSPCSATLVGQTCGSGGGNMLDAEHGFCSVGGDVITVHAYGFGLDETKTVPVPAEYENCPQPPAPEPEPQPSQIEPSQTSETTPTPSAFSPDSYIQ